MPALESPDYRKKDKAWQEWIKELTKMQKGFNFACSQQRFIRRRQEVQIGIFQSLAHLDSYERKAKVAELFKEVDQDGSGEVDKDELQKCFEILGVKPRLWSPEVACSESFTHLNLYIYIMVFITMVLSLIPICIYQVLPCP